MMLLKWTVGKAARPGNQSFEHHWNCKLEILEKENDGNWCFFFHGLTGEELPYKQMLLGLKDKS